MILYDKNYSNIYDNDQIVFEEETYKIKIYDGYFNLEGKELFTFEAKSEDVLRDFEVFRKTEEDGGLFDAINC